MTKRKYSVKNEKHGVSEPPLRIKNINIYQKYNHNET